MQAIEGNTATEPDEASLTLSCMADPLQIERPHVLYQTLRELDPVHWDPYMHAWVVTSYSEVVEVITNYSSDRAPRLDQLDRMELSIMKPLAELMMKQMLFMDGPMHARLRKLCAVAFTPQKVGELRSTITALCNDLLDDVLDAEELDLVADFAAPVPAITTANLMGIPIEDYKQLGRWVNDIAELHGNFYHHPNRITQLLRSLDDIKAYIAQQVTDLRRHPNSGLISSLITAEVDGQRLTEDEIVATSIVTIIGGHETTTNLIATGFLTLIRNPKSFEHLRTTPEIIASAVEELLRFESPVQHTARIAPSDMELGGKKIRKGAKVVAVLAAANRDPRRFPEPDRLDLVRADNRHLAFGWGPHFCFGASLARMEAQLALTTLLRRLTQPVVLDEVLHWRVNAGLRGLTSLRIGFSAGAAR